MMKMTPTQQHQALKLALMFTHVHTHKWEAVTAIYPAEWTSSLEKALRTSQSCDTTERSVDDILDNTGDLPASLNPWYIEQLDCILSEGEPQ